MKQNTTKKAAEAPKATVSSSELTKLFKDQLKDVLSAEKQLTKALPKMAKASTSEELRAAFTNHLEETNGQIARLEQVFGLIGAKPVAKHCEAMEGLAKEGKEAIEETEDGTVFRDVVLIIAAQKVEHYEIAAYGSLRSIAKILGLNEAVALLQETLDQEGNADKLLTQISDTVNVEAEEEG